MVHQHPQAEPGELSKLDFVAQLTLRNAHNRTTVGELIMAAYKKYSARQFGALYEALQADEESSPEAFLEMVDQWIVANGSVRGGRGGWTT